MSFRFKVASCSCAGVSWFVVLYLPCPPIMYSHPYHTVMFFKNSTLLHPVDVTVNCFTFHHVLQLPSADANLYWALGCCFVCGLHSHRSEACSQPKVSFSSSVICWRTHSVSIHFIVVYSCY